MTTSMTTQDTPRKLSKKEFKQIYWRSFTLLGSFNYERMEGLGFLYAMMPSLKRIWKDDPEGYKAALHRHIAAFNMTVAPSPSWVLRLRWKNWPTIMRISTSNRSTPSRFL